MTNKFAFPARGEDEQRQLPYGNGDSNGGYLRVWLPHALARGPRGHDCALV